MDDRPLVMIRVTDLKPYANNPRTHSDSQVQQIVNSIEEFGFTNPLLVDQYGGIIAGHGRLLAAQKMGMETVPCIKISDLSPKQKQALVIADNKLALNAGWNDELLIGQLQELQAANFNIDLTGFGEDELADLLHTDFDPYDEGSMGSMAANYGVPPFSILNAREGTWQDRKRHWIDKGIQSELGRDIGNTSASPDINRGPDEGGSIFDPVLCELMYAWFTGKDFVVLDPFAGGSVRGIVAAEMGRYYVGVELRGEQVEANIGQREEICAGRPFKKSRKLGKAHQNILVFVKGDPVKATEACGVVDIPDLENMEEE